MQEINRVLSAAAWRLAIGNFFKGFVYVGAALVVGVILARIVQQVFGLEFYWRQVAYACTGAAVLGAVIWSIAARPSKAAVARRVDEGANLKELLSTALGVEKYQNDDPWARVTVESAVRQARGVRVSHAVPINAPKFWPVPFALAIVFGIVWMVFPRLDVLGWKAKAIAAEKTKTEFTQVKLEQKDIQKKIEEMSEKLGLEKDKVDPFEADKPEPRNPEEIKKAVLKDLTKMSERLEQLRSGEKGQKLDAIQKNLQNLKTPGEQTSELTKAMANSNFQLAQKELEKMKDQLSSASLNEQQKQQLAEQLENLSKQLSEMAKNKDALEQAMKNAGLDPKKAGDPEAAKKAIEQAKNLTPEQKQQLQEMAQSQSQCKSAMDGLSQACSKMGQCAKSGDKEGAEKAAGQMAGQMAQIEQLKQEMDLADAAKGECQGKMAGMCNKPGEGEGECKGGGDCNGDKMGSSKSGAQKWSANWCNGQGNRMDGSRTGGGGRGQGGVGGSETAGFQTDKRKDMGLKGNGPIVSSRMVEGDSIKGESHAEFVDAVTKAEQSSSEAFDQNIIPREFHDAIKNYFGNLKKGTSAKDAAPEEKPAKPAEEAKDAGK